VALEVCESAAGIAEAFGEPPEGDEVDPAAGGVVAAVRWEWIERNVAADVPNPTHARMEFIPFHTWEEVEAAATELGPFGPLAIFSVGTGVRPEEAFGIEWVDVDLEAGVFTVRRSFARGRLKQ
jgi:integrase